MNEELILSAIAFLKDPNVSGSPLTKKVEFLESKGLNQQEIEESLRRVNEPVSKTTSSNQSVQSTNPALNNNYAPPIDYYNSPPELPDRSWKDYFIMATATVGVTYGLYQVVNKYLIPSIIPPSQSSIEKDKQKIDEEFIKIDKILEQLSEDQAKIKDDNDSKLKEIDVVIDNVNDYLSKYNKDKLKFDDDLRLMKLEIDNLSNSIEKNMALTKETINDELQEINSELQSLKQLIKTRSSTGGNNDGKSETRKIAPVSSIPSASEILRRAKAKSAAASSVPPVSSPPKSPTPEAPSAIKETVISASSTETATPKQFSPPAPATTSGGVTAAGIPAWQLKHKEDEEKSMAEDELTVQQNISKVGVPSWQLNSSTKDVETKPEIPSWQLNSQTS